MKAETALEVDEQGRIRLPPEILHKLGSPKTFEFSVSDDGGGALILRPGDADLSQNARILDEIAELNRRLSDDDYTAPVPQSFLDK